MIREYEGFKIGDRVIAIKNIDDYETKGEKGNIVDFEKNELGKMLIVVTFDNDVDGWEDEDYCIPKGHGLYASISDICLLDKPLELECKLMQETIEKAKEMNKLQVRYIDKNLTPMQKIAKGDLVDLRASRIFSVVWNDEKQENEKIEKTFPYHYKAGETLFVKLGFAMKLPENKKANVYPRSGLFNNYGLLLTNSVGQIDNSYNGSDDQWCAMFWATRDGVINYDDRILQFDISERTMQNIEFELVEQLEDVNRQGFGSTGVK